MTMRGTVLRLWARLAPVNNKSGHRTIRKGGWDPFPHLIDQAMGEKFSSPNLWSKRVASQRLTLVGAKEAVVNGPSLPMKPRNPVISSTLRPICGRKVHRTAGGPDRAAGKHETASTGGNSKVLR